MSTTDSKQVTQSTPQQVTVTTNKKTYRIPSDVTLQNASKLSITLDKPILLDYWADSLDKKIIIGVNEKPGINEKNEKVVIVEKMLVKSIEEYTSPIGKMYKSGMEIIVITENSIYIISSDTPSKKIESNFSD